MERYYPLDHPARGEFSVAVLGNLETRDFELVPLLDMQPGIHEAIAARNLSFVGVLGIVNGSPRSAFELPIDNAAVADLVAAYLAFVDAGMKARMQARMNERFEIAMLDRMLWPKPPESDS